METKQKLIDEIRILRRKEKDLIKSYNIKEYQKVLKKRMNLMKLAKQKGITIPENIYR